MKKIFYSILLLVMLFSTSSVRTSSAWSWDVHKTGTDFAFDLLPDSIKSDYNDIKDDVIEASINADQRKSFDPTEDARHFDDSDIPHKDRNVPYGSMNYSLGVVSWAVENSTRDLTKALEENNKDDIIRYMADVAHYIQDSSQPFHATSNYNGQKTGNNGIHGRVESSLITYYPNEIYDFEEFEDLVYIKDSYQLSESQISSGLALVPTLLDADDQARAADDYWSTFSDLALDIVKDRIKLAIQNTANLWYSAFIDAGIYDPDAENSFLGQSFNQIISIFTLTIVIMLVLRKQTK